MIRGFAASLALAFLTLALAKCSSNPYAQGKTLYEQHCANCHMSNGEGLAALIPPLKSADFLEQNRSIIPCIVKYGIEEPITVNGFLYDIPMEGISKLNEVEITNIVNYVFSSWGNNVPAISVEEVKAAIDSCKITTR